MIDVINLSGKKYAGKDHVYARIKDLLKDSRVVIPYRWADPLKEDVIEMMAAVGQEITREMLDDNSHPLKPIMTGLMQWYGTEYHRHFDYDYWVNRGIRTINGHLRTGEDLFKSRVLVVINDSRFLNEVEIPAREFRERLISIRLEVSSANQDARAARLGHPLLSDTQRNHRSEVELDGYDGFNYRINANAPLGWMLEEVQLVLQDAGLLSSSPVQLSQVPG